MATSESQCSLSMNNQTRLSMADDNQDQNPTAGRQSSPLTTFLGVEDKSSFPDFRSIVCPIFGISTSTTGVATQWCESIRSAKH